MKGIAIVLIALSVGCGSAPRFRDAPIVWRVDDDGDIPLPEEREYLAAAYMAENVGMRPLTRALELPDLEPARDTNALDEVPDSTWFTNRIGVRAVSPAEAAIGPVSQGPPQPPLRVVSGKGGGGNPGFILEDSRGLRYVTKLDTIDNPEMQTATAVIVNRIFWTLGYNVPEDTIFVMRREELSVKPGATRKDELGRAVPITEAWVDEVLAQAPPQSDGSYRAAASLFLDGVPVGGWAMEGTRPDDPNDTIDHQHRRVLRALRVFAAWTGHTDIKEDNTLDMWVERDGRRFLVHYLLDFGEALGAHQAEKHRPDDGFEHVVDWELNGAALLALGFWRRPWELQRETPWPSVGAFSAAHFDPRRWREAYPYWPLWEADAADLYWGAKLVMRFEREHLRAIVDAGELSDPAAAAWLVDALYRRRSRIGRAWLEDVSPLDHFRMREGRLCMIDVAVRSGIAGDGLVERLPHDYTPQYDDDQTEPDRRAMGVELHRVSRDGTVCVPVGAERYGVARLRTLRGPERRPVMQVHYRGGRAPRVLGVIRVE